MVNQPAPAVGQASQLFDLQDSDGVNESERILTALCRKSFLRLWSQTNVYTDEGFKDGKGATKELCDALIIFGNDVIIFSDKHITFQTEKALKVAWARWYKRAVFESIKQLHGAKGWLQRFPERAYLDPQCTRRLPVAMPAGQDARFHLVAVTRGSRDVAIANIGGLGSFLINTLVTGRGHEERPFTIGQPLPEKHFVHVFDEVSIELVMQELDTASDFVEYLRKREALLGSKMSDVLAPGEEELLAAYLINMNEDESEHVFLPPIDVDEAPDTYTFGGDHFSHLNSEPAYLRKKQADLISYQVWDKLIDNLIRYGDPTFLVKGLDQSLSETERGLRLLASESRFRRRILSQSLIDAIERVGPGQRLGRLIYGGVPKETVYVFAVVPQMKGESYAEYREYRTAILHAYVRTARLRAPLGTVFVGIAVDNPHKEGRGGSEDIFVWMQETWTDEELHKLEVMREKLGLWGDAMEYSRYRQDEFPQEDQFNPIQRVPNARQVQRSHNSGAKREKNVRKMQKGSKRRNRRRKS
ncbi:hypothetical protein [Herbaspirillum robiniae]|uniref:hypothetical protein n=1 Tax=Herbaspirillum robiniae TaxID=2014887 RepID=UPI003D76E0FE